jgi:hypothetical protein
VFNHLTEVLGEVVAAGLGVLPTPNNPFNPYDDPAMMLVANATMAPAPQTPVEALETSVNVLLGSVKALPGGIEDLATAVQKGYITVPLTALIENAQFCSPKVLTRVAPPMRAGLLRCWWSLTTHQPSEGDPLSHADMGGRLGDTRPT